MLKIINLSFRVIAFIVILISQPITAEDNAPIIQPGAPGESSKNLDAEAATAIADSSYTKADVNFLQGMIVHHQQAIVMSALAPKRTNNQTILDLALRIDVSQEDEINFMESWLKARNENVPDTNEINKNIRSRSAKLRYAIRSDNTFINPEEFKNKFINYYKLEEGRI